MSNNTGISFPMCWIPSSNKSSTIKKIFSYWFQISQILNQLLLSSGYDKQIRPQITGPPLDVEVKTYFSKNLFFIKQKP